MTYESFLNLIMKATEQDLLEWTRGVKSGATMMAGVGLLYTFNVRIAGYEITVFAGHSGGTRRLKIQLYAGSGNNYYYINTDPSSGLDLSIRATILHIYLFIRHHWMFVNTPEAIQNALSYDFILMKSILY